MHNNILDPVTFCDKHFFSVFYNIFSCINAEYFAPSLCGGFNPTNIIMKRKNM